MDTSVGRTIWWPPDGKLGCWDHCPDYLNDLNAMHEAEKTLENQFKLDWAAYWRNLERIPVLPHPIFATPAQRAEAFLRTIGKWEEES